MFASKQPHCRICEWILQNEEKILSEAAEYNGIRVTESTEVMTYRWTVSLLFVTCSGETSHCLEGDSENSRSAATLTSLILGWWGFPFGPFSTIRSLMHNASGGSRTTVGAILARERWGVILQGVESQAQQHKAVCRVTDAAITEIERRRSNAGFEHSIAAMLVPEDSFQRTCSVEFDFPVSDGNQWIFCQNGMTFLIRKRDEEYFHEKHVHFLHDQFLVREEFEVT